MNVGLVARADDRGIGTMTWEFHKAMTPARTLVVREPGAEARGFAAHPERYPDAVVALFDPRTGQLDEAVCREFLDGLDVVYLVETPYDYRFLRWAREARCASVLHVMPEFWRWDDGSVERPDVWWLPTTWRADLLPVECRIVEVPVPERPRGMRPPAGDVVFVHSAGHRAVGDRNGTLLLYQAVRSMRSRCTVRVHAQADRVPQMRAPANVNLELRAGGVEDRWAVYDDADVLVLPRRYGGLCLPVLEAMASGLAVVMPGVEPQLSTWPVIAVQASRGRSVEMPCGTIKLADANPATLARMLDRIVADPTLYDDAARASQQFAGLHSWARLRPLYDLELERAVTMAGSRRRVAAR